MHRHRDIRLKAIEAVDGSPTRALCVPGLHVAKAGDRHDGSINGPAPLRSGWNLAQDADLLADVDLVHREVVLIEEPPDHLGGVQRLVL